MSRKKYVRQDNLAGILKKHDIKNKEFAKLLGLSESTVSKYINGYNDISNTIQKVIQKKVNEVTGLSYTRDDLFV